MYAYTLLRNRENGKQHIVRDSNNLYALIFHVFWALYNRLWLLFLLVASYMVAVNFLFKYINGGMMIQILIESIPLFYMWIYGNSWRMRKLQAKGYQIVRIIHANNESEAEYKAMSARY